MIEKAALFCDKAAFCFLKLIKMQIFVNEQPLKRRIAYLKSKGNTIGFVPTMGALHKGHISLIEKSKSESDITVCSIFVNPTQFNNKEDLLKYPKTIEEDKRKLLEVGNDILFIPSEKVIYPPEINLDVDIDLEGLENKWEGEFRPGHFNGVVQVVKRLLVIVKPDYLYMGQKDFQQFTIIKMMLEKLKMDTKLIVVPIYREKDGLAMSSRNVRLTEEFREKSTVLYQSLLYAKENYGKETTGEIEKKALEMINGKGLKPEYFKIVNGRTLDPVSSGHENNAIAIVAAWAGDVRLIDNIIITDNL